MKKKNSYVKSFLKFPGNKHRVLEKLLPLFPAGKRFIEPFVGSGVVFANTNYERYLLGDTNKDLINLFQYLHYDFNNFIELSREYFEDDTNNLKFYNDTRDIFNGGETIDCDFIDRCIYFLYLNRTCFNGLVRYNKENKFNVPFGKHKNIYFPEKELKYFGEKLSKCVIVNNDFQRTMSYAGEGDIIYCDPPYCPIGNGFTNFYDKSFGMEQHRQLVVCAETAREKGATCLISNHNLEITRTLYSNATSMISFPVRRSISGKVSGRGDVQELVVVYK